ncbi:MAG TPA: hypothetical protein VD997_10935 [Phycisphaerales bacterium]|nr:hypothetical protein [Phycisphaerales bacterium]
MKTPLVALIGVAGSASAALGVVNTRVEFLLSMDGGPYVSHLYIPSNTGVRTVDVVVRMTYIGPGTAAGFASAVFQPVVMGWQPGDVAFGYVNGGLGSNVSSPAGVVPDSFGQYGRISPFGRTALSNTSQALFNHVHTGNAGAPPGGSLRIAQRSATSWIGSTGNTTGGQGVPVAQLANVGRTATDPAFNPSTTVSVFRWGMLLDSGTLDGSSSRALIIDAPLSGFGNRVTTLSPQFPGSAIGDREVYWWGDMNASTGDLRGQAVVSQAVIQFNAIPTPASLGALVLGALVTVRRQRSSPTGIR